MYLAPPGLQHIYLQLAGLQSLLVVLLAWQLPLPAGSPSPSLLLTGLQHLLVVLLVRQLHQLVLHLLLLGNESDSLGSEDFPILLDAKVFALALWRTRSDSLLCLTEIWRLLPQRVCRSVLIPSLLLSRRSLLHRLASALLQTGLEHLALTTTACPAFPVYPSRNHPQILIC